MGRSGRQGEQCLMPISSRRVRTATTSSHTRRHRSLKPRAETTEQAPATREFPAERPNTTDRCSRFPVGESPGYSAGQGLAGVLPSVRIGEKSSTRLRRPTRA